MNFLYILKRNPFWIGLVVRLVLAYLLPLLLDNGPVPYTDIDYHVFMDAAEYIKNGFSPYDRHTYRYTPFLAKLLSLLLFREAGRYLFCVADAVCGSLIIRLRQQSRGEIKKEQEITYMDCLWWMYNPLAINICTRGSAESLVLLPVLLTVHQIVMIPKTAGEMSTTLFRSSAAGILHGIAIHSKLYPIIYTLSFMAYLTQRGDNNDAKKPTSIVSFLLLWTRRLLQPAPLLFGVTSLFTFIILTYLAVLQYGQVALEEGLLYHLSRVDHRHNYSIFWYSIYLGRAQVTEIGMNVVGRLLLVPQFVLLVVSSLTLAPYDLGLALFVQTYLFVSLNKVITAQYFTWYLCLLPLCSRFDYTRVRFAFVLLGLSILFWLASAYCLEMQGWAVHRVVWVASLLFFGANINLLRALLRSSTSSKKIRGGIKQD